MATSVAWVMWSRSPKERPAGYAQRDGTTPLLRAVDLGSPALVGATLDKDPRLRIAATERKRIFDVARRAGLRRRPDRSHVGGFFCRLA
ncbi:hypothetical protein ACWEWI_36715 [Streptomyces sp. NPDC003753]|uniref:hypothetical protein n=1 Tax=Streptomyces sp. Y2F8-2 TaxID=2759675 RepID=UPI0019053E71|nr:hypothetical protein [Streptomyces sp. Y2F8-2]